jgi:hypothetical protein
VSNCGNVSDFLQTIRQGWKDDCEPQRYSDEYILKRINMAMLAIYAIRPDEFPQTKVSIPLVAGANQSIPVGLTVFEVLSSGYLDKSGDFKPCSNATPSSGSNDFLGIYTNRCQKAATPSTAAATIASKCDGYNVSSYSYKQKDGGFFTVSPPVPEGTIAHIQVLASSCPKCRPETLSEELPCKLLPLIYEKTMVYLFDSETEDNLSIQKMNAHELRYKELYQSMYRTDAQIGSGFYRGERGNGDGTPQRWQK